MNDVEREALEHFPANRTSVRVAKMRQNGQVERVSDSAGSETALLVRITRDHLYIEATSYERHLAPVGSVALLRENDDLLILPVLGRAAGGFYVKQINARGDRAVHAADFLRLNGIDETIEFSVAAAWNEGIAGYAIRDFFAHARAGFVGK
jgi:hypothetical protein